MKGFAKIHEWDMKGFASFSKIHEGDVKEGYTGGGTGPYPLYTAQSFLVGQMRKAQGKASKR
jgi:hypothetical protein